MGIINKVIPKYTKLPDGTVVREDIPEQVYIDDAFDPLFNKKAQAYLNYKYGNPFLGTLGGFAEGIDNALIGQKDKWGILGPGMGILSGFGRTMDKAEDFILGGLTEGVNAISSISPFGADIKPENPLENIFVEDEDYTGKRLLAAMGNSMSKLAGDSVLEESDFKGLWNIPNIGIELMTDPGIIGGSLVKNLAPELANTSSKEIIKNMGSKPTKHMVGEVGQLLSNYDDMMAKIAWDATAPGLRPLVKQNLLKIDEFIAAASHKKYTDTTLNNYTDNVDDISKNTDSSDPSSGTPDVSNIEVPKKTSVTTSEEPSSPPLDYKAILNETKSKIKELKNIDNNIPLFEKMVDDIAYSYKLSDKDPELFNLYIKIKNNINSLKINEPGTKEFEENITKELNDFFKTREIKYNEELSSALNKTKAGKLINYGNGNPENFVTISELSEMPDIQHIINDLDDTDLGPGYLINLDYYRRELDTEDDFLKYPNDQKDLNDIEAPKKYKPSQNLDYEGILEDLLDGTLKSETGDVFDDKIIDTIYNRLEKPFKKYHYTSPDVKIFYSPVGRRNDAKVAAKYTDAKFKMFLKKHFGKDSISADEFIKAFKENILVEEMFEKDALKKASLKEKLTKEHKINSDNLLQEYNTKINGPTIKDKEKFKDYIRKRKRLLDEDFDRNINFKTKSLSEQFEKKVKKFLESKIYTSGEDTLKNYFKNLEDFTDFITRNFGGTLLEGSTFYKDLLNFAEDYNKNVIEPMTLTTKPLYAGPGELQRKSYLGDLNAIIGSRNYAFKNELGEFDLEAFDEFRQALPSYEVRIMPKVKKQIYKKGEMDSFLNPLEEHLRKVEEMVDSAKSKNQYLNYKELNPYLLDIYKNVKLDPTKQAVYSYVIGGGWEKTAPKNISLDEAIRRIDIARNGLYSGNELLRFTKTRFKETPELTKINSSDFVNTLNLKTDVNKAITDTYTYLNNKALAKEVVNPTPVVEHVYEDVTNKVLGDTEVLKETFGSVEEGVKALGTKEQKRWFPIINAAKAIKNKIRGGDYATLREKRVVNLTERATKLKEKYNESDVLNYFKLKDMQNEDIIKGDNFISTLAAAKGRVLIPLNTKTQASKIKELTDAINYNIAATSYKGKPVFELVSKNVGNDTVIIGYKALEDTGVVKRFNKIQNVKGLKDLNIHKAEKVDLTAYKDLEDFFDESRQITEEFSSTLGFTDFTSDYFKHVMSDNPKAGEWLNKTIYNNENFNIDNLDEISTVFANILNKNGTFRIQPMERSLRGNLADWNSLAPIFSTDLEAITKSSFSKGIFDNVNYQTYVDLFVNDNFKIKNYARTTDDIKKILYAGYETGDTGNLSNTLLVAPIYNESGRLIKFKRFDKFSESGLEAALKNEDTILIPTSVLTPLDKILRKDAKMSNKVFRFVNKYLTIPFKFGTLMNPGFLAGNLSDAYFKQAVTMSQKYGTNLSEELTNVAKSLRQVYDLNNKFDDIYRQKFLGTYSKDILEQRKFLNISDNIIKNSKINQEFKEWLKNAVAKNELSKHDENIVRLWMFLNDTQTSTTFKASTVDLGEAGSILKNSPYTMPTTPIEGILTGSKQYNRKDPKTWGLFANNPLSNAIIDSSAVIENYFRSACILNDLKRSYTGADISKILSDFEFKETGFEESFETLNVKMMDAINTMYAANFDYENMSDFMDGISTVIPFPTFFMKNLGYWLEIMVDNPELIDSMITTQTGLWSDRDLENNEFQAASAGRGAIPTDVTGIPQVANAIGGQKLSNLFKGIYKPSPMNSMFSAFNLINNPIEDVAFRLNPALSPITRHLQDEDSVKYRPYSTNQYERNIKPDNPKFNELEYLFHRINPFERQINTYLRTPVKLNKGEAQLSDFVPSIFQPDF